MGSRLDKETLDNVDVRLSAILSALNALAELITQEELNAGAYTLVYLKVSSAVCRDNYTCVSPDSSPRNGTLPHHPST